MADEQTSEPFGPDDASGQGPLDPAGEELARHAEPQAGYVVDDPEAEELTDPPVNDPAPGTPNANEVLIDDQQQLADAEQVAARARSSRPVRRKPGQSAPAPAAAQAVPDEEQADAPRSATPPQPSGGATAAPAPAPMPRPVRRRPVAEPSVTDADATNDLVARATVERPTRRRPSQEVATPRRTTPALFVNQSVAELRKVIWPTGNQLRQYFTVVLLFVLFIVAYVGLLDTFFGWIVLKLFSK